jgi:hypothetical protein
MTFDRYDDRLHIDAMDEKVLGRWAKHLGVSRHELLDAIDKVGNNATEVRKQLLQIDPAASVGASQ